VDTKTKLAADSVRSNPENNRGRCYTNKGRLRDFERDGSLAKSPKSVLETLTDEMLDDVHSPTPASRIVAPQIGKGQEKSEITATPP
jgi:hypothetical protein